MSDNWIVIIPADPHNVPDEDRRERARQRFAEIAPRAEEVNSIVSPGVELRDCGANLEHTYCPSCRAEMSEDWLEARLEDDRAEDGFTLTRYVMPCCRAQHSLNELSYHWHQGFSRYALEVMNPDLGLLPDSVKAEMEGILGTPVRVIHQHI